MNDNFKNEINFSKDELVRYSRQITLPEFGIESQKLLKSASVLCVGAGGLGSSIILYLASAGVGKIGIIDNDIVELSNLHRQVIHNSSSIGELKTISAKDRISEINPNCKVKIFNETISSENALKIIEDFDYVCDGSDNFPAKYLVNDACVILDKPLIYGAIFKFEGQVSVFNKNADSPNYRDLIPEPPPNGIVPTCAEGGVIGILPGIIGLIQATETIKLITNIGETLDKRLLIFNALSMEFRELKLEKSNPPIEIKELINYQNFCGIKAINPNQIDQITCKEIKAYLEKTAEKLLLIDVRTESERSIDFIKNSVSIPLENILNNSQIDLLKDKYKSDIDIVLYCKSGIRSLKALNHLKEKNIKCKMLEGGMDAWNKLHI